MLRHAWRLWNRVSCALQHAAPVGGTEGQDLGLVRWFGETGSDSIEAALGMQAEGVAVYLPLFDESPIAKLQDPICLCEKSLSGRSEGRTYYTSNGSLDKSNRL